MNTTTNVYLMESHRQDSPPSTLGCCCPKSRALHGVLSMPHVPRGGGGPQRGTVGTGSNSIMAEILGILNTWERHSLYLLELSFVVTPAFSGSSLSHSHLSTNLSDSYLSMFSNLPMILSPHSFLSPGSLSQSNSSLVTLLPGIGEMALRLGAHCSPRGPEFSPGLTKV